MVEHPEIYIMAKCADTIAEKPSYVKVRRDDVIQMNTPLVINNTTLKDSMRFFQGIKIFSLYFLTILHVFCGKTNYVRQIFYVLLLGDHPELQFEAGNQIGGSYPCMCGTLNTRFF